MLPSVCVCLSFSLGTATKKNPIYVFHFGEFRGLSPNSHIHVAVSDLYIPRIGPHVSCSRIGRPTVVVNCFEFPVLVLWRGLAFGRVSIADYDHGNGVSMGSPQSLSIWLSLWTVKQYTERRWLNCIDQWSHIIFGGSGSGQPSTSWATPLALVLLPTSAGESSRRWTNRYRSWIHERTMSGYNLKSSPDLRFLYGFP